MADPRLTIGIPTVGARPGLLTRAVRSALGQGLPAKVLIADQSGDDRVEHTLGPYLDNPLIRIVKTHGTASCLWDNWRLAAEHADTEYFGWLQDDDVIAGHYSRRLVGCLDACPSSAVWIARLGVSHDGINALPGQCAGPFVPMDMLHGTPREVQGGLMAACAHFTSFALSPGVGFRVTDKALAAVGRVPTTCDLFAERSVLAELGTLGPVVCDPAMVGYWVHHDSNESARQIEDGVEKQFRPFFDHLDPIIRGTPSWRDLLRSWAILQGASMVRHHIDQTEIFEPHSDLVAETREIMRDTLRHLAETGKGGEPAPVRRPLRERAESAMSRTASRAERAVA